MKVFLELRVLFCGFYIFSPSIEHDALYDRLWKDNSVMYALDACALTTMRRMGTDAIGKCHLYNNIYYDLALY